MTLQQHRAPTTGIDSNQYQVDGLAPRRVERPASPEEVAAALADAARAGEAVVPWGGGVRQSLGAPLARYDVALDLRALDAVVEYEPADLTITVQAGMTLARLAALLAEHGQAVALESPFPDRATVGGTLAAGLAGPLSHSLGGPRERLIGLRVALADGSLIRGGGRVVKNVAGYDLPRLFVGSLGTLGVITEASFKLIPLPPVPASVVVHADSAVAAARLAANIVALDLPFRSIEAGTTSDGAVVAVDCSGRPRVVARLRAEVAGPAGGAPVDVLEGDTHAAFWRAWQEAGLQDGATVVRMVVPPGRTLDLVEAAGTPLHARPGTGVVRALLEPGTPAADAARLREVARRLGGLAILEHGPAELRRGADAWGPLGPVAVMARLREEYDPGRSLNPGRMGDVIG